MNYVFVSGVCFPFMAIAEVTIVSSNSICRACDLQFRFKNIWQFFHKGCNCHPTP